MSDLVVRRVKATLGRISATRLLPEAEAIRAAARGGWINILITDLDVAEALAADGA